MPEVATLSNTPTFDPADDRLVIARAVARRFGISIRSLERWIKADHIGFPQPDLITKDVAGRPANRFWKLSTLVAWESQNIRPKLGRPAAKDAEAA